MTDTKRSPAERTAVIGTGAIGSAVTRHLLAAGHRVQVWNRSADRTADLVTGGARRADSVEGALSSSDLAFVTLKDHEAVEDSLFGLGADLSGTTVLGMYTGTPSQARETARRVTALGADYLDVGIQASPEMLGTDTATLLYSGPRRAFDRYEDTLRLLGTPRYVSEAPEAAAVWDLALFGVWYDAQLGLLRALDMARDAGIDLAEFATTAGTQLGHVVAAASATSDEMRQGDYPSGPATLAEHLTVVHQLIALRAGQRLGDGGLPVVAEAIEKLVAADRDSEGLTAVTDPTA